MDVDCRRPAARTHGIAMAGPNCGGSALISTKTPSPASTSQRLGQRRQVAPGTALELPEVLGRVGGDRLAGGEGRVVNHHELAVHSRVDIEFHAITSGRASRSRRGRTPRANSRGGGWKHRDDRSPGVLWKTAMSAMFVACGSRANHVRSKPLSTYSTAICLHCQQCRHTRFLATGVDGAVAPPSGCVDVATRSLTWRDRIRRWGDESGGDP